MDLQKFIFLWVVGTVGVTIGRIIWRRLKNRQNKNKQTESERK